MLDFAERAVDRIVPRPKTAVARAGLAFERKFVAELRKTIKYGRDSMFIEHNPTFRYRQRGSNEDRICIPDIIITDVENGFIIVVETKQTFVPNAMVKLKELYCPVVTKVFGQVCVPLVVCRHLAPGAPLPASRISFALTSNYPLYQWLGSGPILF